MNSTVEGDMAEKKGKGKGASKKKGPEKSAAKKTPVKKSGQRKMPGGRLPTTPEIDTTVSLEEWTNTEKVILARRSVRSYKKKQVREPLVRRILECGRYAPSAGNCQPWRFVVVRDAKMIEEMEADAKKALKTMAKVLGYDKHPWKKYHTKLLQFLSPNNLHPIPMGMIQSVTENKFDVFWGAPTVILLFKDKRGIGNPDVDLGICGQNMVIAAHGMGLGTCWIGVASVLQMFPKWRKRFNIRHPWYLEQGMLVGYPFGDPNGFAHRETQYVDWFDDDGHRVVS